MTAGPYTSSTEHVRDLLETVRVHLMHREAVLDHAARTTGLGPREILSVGTSAAASTMPWNASPPATTPAGSRPPRSPTS